jgi:hypothetical protein
LMPMAAATTSTRMSAGIQVRTANYCRQATGSAGSLTRIELAAVAAGVGERAHYAGPGCRTGRPASLCIARASLAVVPEVPLSLHPDYVTHVECAWPSRKTLRPRSATTVRYGGAPLLDRAGIPIALG